MSENERVGGFIDITRTVTFVQRIPYNDEYYAGMTIEEAIKYEERLPLGEKLDTVVEQLPLIDFSRDGSGTYVERITYSSE